jgi:hypothetical protein
MCIIFTHNRNTHYNSHYKAPPRQASWLLCLHIMVTKKLHRSLCNNKSPTLSQPAQTSNLKQKPIVLAEQLHLIHNRHMVSIFSHMKLKTVCFRNRRDTCEKWKGYTKLHHSGKTISNSQFTATASPVPLPLCLPRLLIFMSFNVVYLLICILQGHKWHSVKTWKLISFRWQMKRLHYIYSEEKSIL